MRYADGNEAKVGTRSLSMRSIAASWSLNIDGGEFSERYASGWGYLKSGILVDTDFGGLVHYPTSEHEHIVLIERAK
jgi:hypothetical protein